MEDVDGHSQKASIMRLIPSFGRAHTEKYYGAKGVVQDCGPRPFKFKSPRGEMNAGLVILRVASERRDAQNDETSIYFPHVRYLMSQVRMSDYIFDQLRMSD